MITSSSSWTKSGRLQRALLDLLRGPRHAGSGALPTSNRFLYYELVQDGFLTKKAPRTGGRLPSQDVSDATFRLRQAGLIPWDWIIDETRALDAWSFGTTIAGDVLDAVDRSRVDCWGGEPPPLILTESRSLAGVLRRLAWRYLCPIAATNGQAGGFLHTEIIPALQARQRVLYFGDLDHAGSQIEQNTQRVIEEGVGRLEWERVALTGEQVQAHSIPPITKTDRRFRDGDPHLAYETEALSQRVIQGLLIARLDELLPVELETVLVREVEQRELLKDRLGRWIQDGTP